MEALNGFYERLDRRYATKKFNPDFKLNESELNQLLEGARLSPSSSGLQPWKFVVVTDQAIRQELKAVSHNQSQITDASALVVFSIINVLDAAYIEKFVGEIAATRGQPLEKLEDHKQRMLGYLPKMQGEAGDQWKTHQLYLSLGFFLITCAMAGIDACPMEGFEADKYDEILKLGEKGISARVLCTIGKRSDTDLYAKAKKVRKKLEDVTIRI